MTKDGNGSGRAGGHGHRVAAIVGPYGAGKTTLLEALLAAGGAIGRKGRVRDGQTVGDASPEARSRQMSTETNVAGCEILGDRWTILDCPGSPELRADAEAALMVADIAIVVVDPVPERAPMLRPLLRHLDETGVPHLLFVNKIDTLEGTGVAIEAVMEAVQAVSARPLVLRQMPIREGDRITGYVDLVSERAYRYRPGQASDLIQMPETARSAEVDARQAMMERLADHDDALLERLLEDASPPPADLYAALARDVGSDLVVPVLLGSAERDHGVRRLMKALRHDAPDVAATAARLAIDGTGSLFQPFRIQHAAHTGRLAVGRVWAGSLADGGNLAGERIAGLWRPAGGGTEKVQRAAAGEIVAVGLKEGLRPGDLASDAGAATPLAWPAASEPVFRLAISAVARTDEVKLSGALHKLCEEDPALTAGIDPATGEFTIAGQGEVHLQLAAERLRSRFNLPVATRAARVPYEETIRRGTDHHARFKRQSGGHGQFADITVTVAPLPRGSGVRFAETVVGGAVPRAFIPAVEAGVREGLAHGPMGHPVVDVLVTLTGGQFHAVDSSEQAFRTAARMAMAEALPGCEPVLLEPVLEVAVHAPSDCTARVQRLLTGRRGQLLGYDARPGWEGWDEVRAHVPQSEMHDLIVELRSITQGVGGFTAAFHHRAELTGRLAEKAAGRPAMAAAQ